MTKKILKITCLTLLSISLILTILTLINYYNYVGTLNDLTTDSLSLMDKFNLQEARETYLYRTLKMTLITSYISIATILTCIATAIVTRKKSQPRKIR